MAGKFYFYYFSLFYFPEEKKKKEWNLRLVVSGPLCPSDSELEFFLFYFL